MPDDVVRPVDPMYRRKDSNQVGYADSLPFLIISQESLEDLNSRLVEGGNYAVPMDRFRPNIVIAGGSPYIEDDLAVIDIGQVVFSLVKPCRRCVTVKTDQLTGQVHSEEPLRTLETYRRREDVAPWFKKEGIFFGWTAVHEIKTPSGSTTISLENPLELIAYRG